MGPEKMITQDIVTLKNSINELGNAVNHAKVDWSDDKFEELKNSIQEIAKFSKRVMMANTHCEKAIRNFRNVESM